MKILCVGGYFSETEGRASGYFNKLVEALKTAFAKANYPALVITANGGVYSELAEIVGLVSDYNMIIWAADVPNSMPKLVASIKEKNPSAMLVVTKSNIDGRYPIKVLTARALKVKANLLIEFGKDTDGQVIATLIDPLGNTFIKATPSIPALASALAYRLIYLSSVTRVGSRAVEGLGKDVAVSVDMDYFFALTRKYAEKFHELIHADDNGRMLGNISFRCESGFPSLRDDDLMFVSRRNVDKRDIGVSGMVPVRLKDSWTDKVTYSGENKPSVDTPIQRELYRAWPAARYMLHAHVYIANAPYTKTVVPCGALEEVIEVLDVLPYYDAKGVAYINLIGHGSIAIASKVEMLENIPYVARPL